MRVAVIGSWREEDALLDTAEAFQAACRRLGRELIARGHSLIVGTESLHTADGNAARGAVDALAGAAPGPGGPRIMLIRPPAAQQEFRELRRSMPGVFVDHVVDAVSWAAVKLVQIQLADAAIGGAEKTEQDGLTPALGGKPLACIGSFGGAAAALNQRFIDSPTTWNYRPGQAMQLRQLQEPFSDAVLHTALEAAWIGGAPKLMIIHGRSPDRDGLKEYLLKSVGRVIVLADEFAPTQPIPLMFERFAGSVDGAIALITPTTLADWPATRPPCPAPARTSGSRSAGSGATAADRS